MPLTAVGIRALQARDKEYTVADGGSLYLVVTPKGGKLWRFPFRHEGKQTKLSIGAWPVVSIAGARAARDEAKRLLAQGINPAAAKRERKKGAAPVPAAPSMPTLRQMARAYIEKRRRENAAASTLAKYEWELDAIGDVLLDRPIDEVTKPDVLACLRVYEATGHNEKVKRVRSLIANIYDFAEGEGHEVGRSPVDRISKSLATPQVEHHPALLDPDDVGEFLRAIEAYKGDPSTMILMRLSPLAVLRSTEIRKLLWRYVSWEDNLIRIPGEAMKVVNGRRREHIVPLSTQARQVLEDALPWSSPKGPKGGATPIMPSLRSKGRTVSENTFNAACRRLGYEVGTVTHHGLRTTFSTWLNETGKWSKDWIEVQLHHLDPDQTRGAYNAALYLDGRRTMMQAWADMLHAARVRPARRERSVGA